MPEYDFSGQVAFVTGAAHGMGRTHALRYAEHGADVVAMDVCQNKETVAYDLGTREELDDVVAEIEAKGQRALAVQGDTSVETDVAAAVDRAVDELGGIDILANNAGIDSVSPLVEMDEQTWDEMLDVNLKGVWLCSKHVGQHFIERGDGGKIVSTSSILGLRGVPQWGHYAAAKHGVVGLTKTLALELADHDVNVNAIAPTGVDTPMVQGSMGTAYDESFMEDVIELTGPWNLFDDGMLQPEEITEAYMWLSSDASQYVTGTTLPVDGGMLAK